MENWRRTIAKEGGLEAPESENRGLLRSDLHVVVRTVEPLSPDLVKAIADKVRQAYQREVLIEVELDHSLLGGLIVLVGHRVIDMSLRTQLRRMSANIAQRLEEVIKELDKSWEDQLTARMDKFLAELRQQASPPAEEAAAPKSVSSELSPALAPGEVLVAAPAG
jgi:hypothetical protein